MGSPLQHSSRWHRYARRPALLEFSTITRACPEGIYVSLQPGNSSEWSGVFFVREGKEGPYAPAILRFRVAFPPKYPEVAPSIIFVSDIFHPLVTPLTTYTYTTGSPSSDTVSATDEERLPPGGFSLRHGFPFWFGRSRKSIISSEASSKKSIQLHEEAQRDNASASHPNSTASIPIAENQTLHLSKAQDDSLQQRSASIREVLEYVKYTFEDETSLDALPLEAAGNPGAWNAWRSHRKGVLPHQTASLLLLPTLNNRDGGEEWSWEGVWEERVQRGVQSSISDAVLYGNSDKGDTLINFVEISDDLLQNIKESLNLTRPP